jgi:hypothetical protein
MAMMSKKRKGRAQLSVGKEGPAGRGQPSVGRNSTGGMRVKMARGGFVPGAGVVRENATNRLAQAQAKFPGMAQARAAAGNSFTPGQFAQRRLVPTNYPPVGPQGG